jgi:hypothetical protein
MNFQHRPHLMTAERRLPFECVTLLLQGGGALGAYQGGVYEALAEANIHPDWIAGISIGAINAAIIAGKPPLLGQANPKPPSATGARSMGWAGASVAEFGLSAR